jgi:glycosyltransferase involved in cell wall biosynthesis
MTRRHVGANRRWTGSCYSTRESVSDWPTDGAVTTGIRLEASRLVRAAADRSAAADQPRRVLMVSSLWPPAVAGGAELYAFDLAAQLRGRGNEVAAVTLGIEGDDVVEAVPSWPYPVQNWREKPIWQRALFRLPDLYNPRAVTGLKRAIEQFRPDVVHSHAVQGLSAAALAVPSRLGVPHVHTLHDYWLLCHRTSMVLPTGQRCERRCMPCRGVSLARSVSTRRHFADVVIAISNSVAEQHRSQGWLDGTVCVIRHPLLPPVAATTASLMRGSHEVPTFGYIGQISRHKGVHTLLAAVHHLDQGPVQLVVAGTGPLVDEVRHDSSPTVRYAGWVAGADKERFFADLDCLVVPSEWQEPAGLVLNEATARGIPVIAADIGGIPEYVPDACRQLMFRAGDVDDLVRVLRAFLSEPERYRGGPPPPLDAGWPEHVDRILGAYVGAAEAAALRSGARR